MPEYELPEFTRSLRALAVPSQPGSDHDRVFKPLIAARTAANKVQSIDAQVAAFDPARLEREWREAIGALAAARHAKSDPDRRALEAELDSLAAPVWMALRGLQQAGAAARAATGDQRRAMWTKWVDAVQHTFNAADDWWRGALPVLGDPRGRRGALWRRILGRSK